MQIRDEKISQGRQILMGNQESISTNARVLALLKERVELGQKKYGQDIPVNGEGGRNNLKESIEEATDMCIYLSATLIELEDKKANGEKKELNGNKLHIQPKDIHYILSGLHHLYNGLYRENNTLDCSKIQDLIEGIKKNCKWSEEDENRLIRNV